VQLLYRCGFQGVIASSQTTQVELQKTPVVLHRWRCVAGRFDCERSRIDEVRRCDLRYRARYRPNVTPRLRVRGESRVAERCVASKRSENQLLDELPIRRTADPFSYRAGNRPASVRVLTSGTRLEVGRRGEDVLHERVALFAGRALQCQQPSQRFPGAVWRYTTGMREQLADAHVSVGRLDPSRELGEGPTDRRLERHQPFLAERANQGCGDGLGQRPEVHPVCRRNQVAFTDPAFAAGVNPRRAIAPDDDGSEAGQLLRQPLAVDESGEIVGGIGATLFLQSGNGAAGEQHHHHGSKEAKHHRQLVLPRRSAESAPERGLSRSPTTPVKTTGRH
jgi:hypothetical protein